MIERKLYTAQARSTGGRTGKISSENGVLSLNTSMQNNSEGTNPEQLFAAGYAACFESTLHVMAERMNKDIIKSSVNGLVDFGVTKDKGYEIAVLIEVSLPGLDQEIIKDLIEAAHQNCPYSKATKGNIQVAIKQVL